ADLEVAHGFLFDTEFAKLRTGFDAGLGVVARHRLRDARGAALAEGNLDGHVAVGFLRLDLGDAAAGAVQHRHGNPRSVVLEDAHHADLAADETETHLAVLSS